MCATGGCAGANSRARGSRRALSDDLVLRAFLRAPLVCHGTLHAVNEWFKITYDPVTNDSATNGRPRPGSSAAITPDWQHSCHDRRRDTFRRLRG